MHIKDLGSPERNRKGIVKVTCSVPYTFHASANYFHLVVAAAFHQIEIGPPIQTRRWWALLVTAFLDLLESTPFLEPSIANLKVKI